MSEELDPQHLTFLQQAIDLSAKVASGELQGAPYTGVVVKDGKVIAEGWSRTVEECDITLHGEIDVIRKAGAKLCSPFLDNCELYANYEPCPMCVAAILKARIKHVYYVLHEGLGLRKHKSKSLVDLELMMKPAAERTNPPFSVITKLQDEAAKHFSIWVDANPDDPRN